MKITNKYNLPGVFVKVAEENLKESMTPGRYSVTEIMKPIKEVILWRRYYDEIEQDVIELIAAMLGTAFHLMIEQVDQSQVEMRLEHELKPGIVLSGRIDKFEDGIITDYKTTTVGRWLRGDFEEYKKQGLMYAWLLKQKNIFVSDLKFHCVLKDFSFIKSEMDPSYPQLPIQTWSYEIKPGELLEIEQWIINRVNQLELLKDAPERELPWPTHEESWYTGDKYAAMKSSSTRAVKLFDNPEDAYSLVKQGKADYVEKRPGRHLKALYSEFFDYIVMNKED